MLFWPAFVLYLVGPPPALTDEFYI